MLRFILRTLNVLCFSTLVVNGQTPTSSRDGLEESLPGRSGAHDQTLKMIYRNVSSRFEKINESFKSVNKGQKKHDRDLRILNQNLTSGIERIENRFQTVEAGLSKMLEIEVKLDKRYHNITSNFARVYGSLQAADERLAKTLEEHDQTLLKMFQNLSSEIGRIQEGLQGIVPEKKADTHSEIIHDACKSNMTVCDCAEIKANGYTTSGPYRVHVDDNTTRYYANAYCDMKTTSGNWMIFQRRMDGSEDFYRGWDDYVTGFGNPNGEFWLGNNFLYYMTHNKKCRLRIDLEDFEGNKRYAEYSVFHIRTSTPKYRLIVEDYSGNAGDSFSYHYRSQFSTKDSDNDGLSDGNCAVNHRGAWWYKNCFESNLNGVYRRGNYSGDSEDGIVWKHWLGRWYSLKTTEMKISPAI